MRSVIHVEWKESVTTRWVFACVILLPLVVAGQPQTPVDLQGLFETGQYQAVVDRLQERAGDPAAVYLAVQSHAKLQQPVQAADLLNGLAARAVEDPWHHVARAALSLGQGDLDQALAHATQGVALGGAVADAHYQLGLVLAARQEFSAAAVTFDAAAVRRAGFAYAFYQAGLAYYRHQRIDLMAARFESFLNAAPQAPERTQVESIMRTVRGR